MNCPFCGGYVTGHALSCSHCANRTRTRKQVDGDEPKVPEFQPGRARRKRWLESSRWDKPVKRPKSRRSSEYRDWPETPQELEDAIA